MKLIFKISISVLFFAVCFSASSFAADSEKLTAAELLAKAKTTTTGPLPVYTGTVTKATPATTISGTGAPLPVAEVNTVSTQNGSVRSLCSGFVYEGPTIPQVNHKCHPGYECHNSECFWVNTHSRTEPMYADNANCYYDTCRS